MRRAQGEDQGMVEEAQGKELAKAITRLAEAIVSFTAVYAQANGLTEDDEEQPQGYL
jgi:hypothetical protein